MHAGQWIARSARNPRLIVEVARHPGHPGELLHRLGEARIVAPRAREPERRHAHHQRVRIQLLHPLPAQPEVLEHARREVLDDRVALDDELLDQLAPLRLGEVEGDVELVAVHVQEVRARLPPLVVVGGHHAAEHAQAVGTSRRFDVDDLGTEVSPACASETGPAHQAVMSRTRRPGEGQGALPSASSSRSPDERSKARSRSSEKAADCVCRPSRGAGRGAGGSTSSIR